MAPGTCQGAQPKAAPRLGSARLSVAPDITSKSVAMSSCGCHRLLEVLSHRHLLHWQVLVPPEVSRHHGVKGSGKGGPKLLTPEIPTVGTRRRYVFSSDLREATIQPAVDFLQPAGQHIGEAAPLLAASSVVSIDDSELQEALRQSQEQA